MSRNKKIIILITILVIIAVSIIGIFIYKNRKVDNIVIGENNKNQIQENNELENIIDNENIIENTVANNTEQINTVEDNTISQNQVVEEIKKAEDTKPIQEKNVKTSTKKENNKTTRTNKQQKTQENKPSQPQKNEQATTSVKNNDNNYKEQEVQIAPKTECKGNNHKIGAGNTGKWFETQEQAAVYFKTEISKWGRKWENFEITDEEYHKNCPYGYEVWTCPQCQKWTVNFYYNK